MPHLHLRGHELGWVDAVLFDKDGTISHSEPMLLALARSRITHCLRLAGFEGRESDRHGGLRNLLQQAYGVSDSGVHPAGAIAVASHDHNLVSTATVLAQVGFGWPDALAMANAAFHYALTETQPPEGMVPSAPPTDGITEFLHQLTRAGVACAVISNDDMQGITRFIKENGLEEHFHAHWSAGHQPSKPNPEAVLGLCRELRVSPLHCALIGDADSDLRMARSAGVPVVLGYLGGWSLPVTLDPSFRHLQHWQEIKVTA